MTSASLDRTPNPRPIRWAWLAFAAFSAVLAVLLGVVTSGECYRGDCSAAFAGGPIGWVAISALVSQSTWAVLTALRSQR